MPNDSYVHGDARQQAEAMVKVHKEIRTNIEKANEMYKKKANKNRKPRVFSPGDLVWIHLRKERFPSKRKHKLMPRSEGPFKVLERYGDNAYKIDLPGEYGVAATFNIGDLSPYLEDEDVQELRTIPFEEGEDDVKSDTNPQVLLSTNLNHNKGEIHGLKISTSVLVLSNEGNEAK